MTKRNLIKFCGIGIALFMGIITVNAQPQRDKTLNGSLAGDKPAVISGKMDNRIDPQATMFSGGASANGLMSSGSTYAPTMTSVVNAETDEKMQQSGRPRKLPDHEEEWWVTPIGDGVVPMMILAVAFLVYRLARRKKNAEEVQQKQ